MMSQGSLIYSAGWQLVKVRGLMWFAMVVGLFALGWGYLLTQTYGLSPGDGGVLRPLWQRLAWGIGVGGLGLLFILGMDLYGRLYIARVFYDPAAQRIEFETLRWWGRAVLPVAVDDIERARYQRGRLTTGAHSVDAPWFYIKIRQRYFPLILDAQGQFPNFPLAARVLGL